VSYDLSDIQLSGKVTARFKAVPLLAALNQLANPHGISIERVNGILVFARGVHIDAAPTDERTPPNRVQDKVQGAAKPPAKVYEEIPLRFLKLVDALALLKGLYPDSSGDNAITVGAVPERNAVYIGGLPAVVTQAVAVLGQADQEVPHVLIEALVVEFDVTAIQQLGTKITGAAIGKFAGINFIPGQLGANLGFTFLDGIVNPATQKLDWR
jgi:hypothetical protein